MMGTLLAKRLTQRDTRQTIRISLEAWVGLSNLSKNGSIMMTIMQSEGIRCAA